MEEVTVQFVEEKTTSTGKTFWLVTFGNGTKASTWEKYRAQILTKMIDQKVMLELSVNGEYTNIGKIADEETLADQFGGVEIPKSQPKKAGFSGGGKADPAKLVSIERQAVAKMVMGYYGSIGKELNQEQFTNVADFVYKWVHQDSK